jgi:hypothetical protein
MSSSIAAELLGISDKCTFELDINLLNPIGLELPDLNFTSGMLDILSDFILSLIGPLIQCINDCYYDGKDIINIKDFFELAGVYIDEAINLDEDIDALEQYLIEWLNKPGFGVQVKSVIGGFLGPISESINFLCEIIAIIFNCIIKPVVTLVDLGASPSPEQLAVAANTIEGLLEDCFKIEIPWPFPLDWFCRWVYSYIKYVFPRVCEDENDSICIDPDILDDIMDSIDGIDFELPSLGVNLSCLISSLLGLDIDEQFDLSYIIMLIIELNPCYDNGEGSFENGPRTSDDQGDFDDFSIDVKFMAQIFGVIIKPIILIFDSFIKPYSCFFKTFIEGFDIDIDGLDVFEFIDFFFGLGLDDIFAQIRDVIKAVFPDLEWDVIEAIEDWEEALDVMIESIPWLCMLKCLIFDQFFEGLISALLAPVVDIIKLIIGISNSIIDLLGGIEGLLDAIKLYLGISAEDQTLNPLEIIMILINSILNLSDIMHIPGEDGVTDENKWCLKLPEIGDCGI